MRVTPLKVVCVCLVFSVLLALGTLFALTSGTASIGVSKVLAWLSGAELKFSEQVILSNFRLPRVLLAILVGGSLSMCGVVFQGLLRNPLAEPFILGVSGGAAAGAVIALSIGLTGLYPRAGFAFAGALGAMVLVITMGKRSGRLESSGLILTGVIINAFFTAVIMFVISITTDQKLHAIMFWLHGDLGGANLEQSWLLLPAVLLIGGFFFYKSRELNLINSGEQAARALGVNVDKVKLGLFVAVSLLAGLTVCLGGLIGFVGLMAPHLVRMALGNDHRLLLPASGLFGALFLLMADTVARCLISPAQLPAGVITASLGAPFFLLLYAKRGSRWL
jgi:iron complex transport system permease protein